MNNSARVWSVLGGLVIFAGCADDMGPGYADGSGGQLTGAGTGGPTGGGTVSGGTVGGTVSGGPGGGTVSGGPGGGTVSGGPGGGTADGGGGTVGTTGVIPPPMGNPEACPVVNPDPTTIPINAAGWVGRMCTEFGIQGAFYCFDDTSGGGGTATDCVAGQPPPQLVTNGEFCLAGATAGQDPGTNWGAALGFNLNNVNETAQAFDATAAGIIGFRIGLSGTTGGSQLQIKFPQVVGADDLNAPQVLVPGVGTYDILFSDALTPGTGDGAAGLPLNASSITDIHVQVQGGQYANNFNYCISELTPILAPPTPPAGVQPYGEAMCSKTLVYGTNRGAYAFQNNVWNETAQADPNQRSCAAVSTNDAQQASLAITNVNFNQGGDNRPAAYPSLIYGWHADGQYRGDYTQGRTIQQITGQGALNSTFTFQTGGGTYNAAYDIWVHPNQNPPDPGGGLELMIWLEDSGNKNPIGNMQGMFNNFQVWVGPTQDWTTLTYRFVGGAPPATLDLSQFFQDATTRNVGVNNQSFVIGVQVGFEIWQSTGNFTINSFEIDIP